MYIKTLLVILALASLACITTTSVIGVGMESPATVTPTATQTPACLRAQTDLYVRAAPNENSPVLNWLYEDNTAQIIEQGADWTRIESGYVKTKYTEKCQ